jgi:hypothetical protein
VFIGSSGHGVYRVQRVSNNQLGLPYDDASTSHYYRRAAAYAA